MLSAHPLGQYELQELEWYGGAVLQGWLQDALVKGVLRALHQVLPQVAAHHSRKRLLAHSLQGRQQRAVGSRTTVVW
jgi:hypothetical protein